MNEIDKRSTEDAPSEITFADLGLPEALVTHLASREITKPTPVQAKVIPLLAPTPGTLSEGDLLAQARTGSGKTFAFLLPLAAAFDSGEVTRAWIICPTRELAQQAAREACWLLGDTAVATLVGGSPFPQQLRELRSQPPLVIGTPGRMADHLRQGTLEEKCDVLVLDEADRMLDMGFKEELDQLVAAAGEDSARWFFSATFPRNVAAAAGDWLSEPRQVRLDEGKGASHVKQSYVVVAPARRNESLAILVNYLEPERGMVFVRTRIEVEEVVQTLIRHGLHAEGLSGELAQSARERALSRFREGKVPILVATDVASRGIDIPGVSHVFNLGLPDDPSNFVHRIGRTARAGAEGEAWSVIAPYERGRFLSASRNSDEKPIQGKIPTARDLVDRRRERLALRVEESIGAGLEVPESFKAMLDEHGAEAVLATLIHKLIPDPPPEEPRRAEIRNPRGGDFRPREGRDEGYEGPAPRRNLRGNRRDPASVWVGLGIGFENGIEVRQLVPMLCRGADIPGSELGRIELLPRIALVGCTPEAAERLLNMRMQWKRRPIRVWEADPPRDA